MRYGLYGSLTILIAGFTSLGILLAPPVTLAPAAEKSKAAEIRATAEIEGQRARGAYLARIGNCLGCHTAYSGFPYAGGHILDTSIGIFITPNITSDKETGIGLWSEEDFWRALHNGRGRDGNLLYPAFPYSEYTKVSREDSDAIFAYLQSLPPVRQRNAPNRINFPFNWRPLLHLWQLIYFSPGIYLPDTLRDDEWNRGAYLVQGLGHCNACHTRRNILGISKGDILGGGQLMGSNWYAPSLTSLQEASTADWPIEDIKRLLKTGSTSRAVTTGPMANVVSQSLQFLTEDDGRAVAKYLKSLPETEPRSRGIAPPLTEEVDKQLKKGGQIYETYCQDCHGNLGEGSPGSYPALAGNRGVTMASPTNAIRSILNGGYAPVTELQQRPYGMPPFAQVLPDGEIALVLSYIRNSWGNRGSLVTAEQVDQSRKGAQ
jgi:mono/diheme cytochrome c family protein